MQIGTIDLATVVNFIGNILCTLRFGLAKLPALAKSIMTSAQLRRKKTGAILYRPPRLRWTQFPRSGRAGMAVTQSSKAVRKLRGKRQRRPSSDRVPFPSHTSLARRIVSVRSPFERPISTKNFFHFFLKLLSPKRSARLYTGACVTVTIRASSRAERMMQKNGGGPTMTATTVRAEDQTTQKATRQH